MDLQSSLRNKLSLELARRKRSNPRYSLRSFARQLHMDPSLLGKFLRSERKLGRKTLLLISKRLKLDAPEITEISKRNALADEKGQINMSNAMIQDWYYFTLAELIRIYKKPPNTKTAAKALGISESDCAKAIETMLSCGAFRKMPNGEYETVSTYVETLDNKTSQVLKNMVQNLLMKSSEALDKWPLDLRANSILTFSLDTAQIPMLKTEIEKFKRKLYRMTIKSKSVDAVYNLQVALFPSIFIK